MGVQAGAGGGDVRLSQEGMQVGRPCRGVCVCVCGRVKPVRWCWGGVGACTGRGGGEEGLLASMFLGGEACGGGGHLRHRSSASGPWRLAALRDIEGLQLPPVE
jgi:hypothetical protein